jgi:hypothetical protein
MMKKKTLLLLSSALLTCVSLTAQNPIIHDQFTADPTARVFGGRVYLYPSHDIQPPETMRQDWFCMADYHVFSSDNLVDWIDHGKIVDQTTVPWVNPTAYSMWAPDCVERDGKYYFYFPAPQRGGGNMIGVAISDTPYGPFVPEPQPIAGTGGIDPCVFIDHDGQAYLYWAGRGMVVAKLKDNMTELAGEPVVVEGLKEGGGLKEGPFLFERAGKYYYTYPWVIEKTEALVYAMGDSPMGPFVYQGIIMDEDPLGCWTNHHSIVEFKGEWYLFYHHNDYSPNFDKNRSTRIDALSFNADGTIQKVIPTLRGVGVTDARSEIQIDRYTAIGAGASIEFLNRWTNPFDGWKTSFMRPGAWVQYNAVEFAAPSKLWARVLAPRGGKFKVAVGSAEGSVVAEVSVPAGNPEWMVVEAPVTASVQGVQNLFVVGESMGTEIDWLKFE